MMLQIYIPSRSRFERSLTLEALDNEWPREHVYLVVPAKQTKEYRTLAKKHDVQLLPCPDDGIALTRLFCGNHAKDKFLMMDDDLRFAMRESGEDWHLYPFLPGDMNGMLHYLEKILDKYVHIAISARGSNHGMRQYYPGKIATRPLRVLGYRKKQFLACEHGRVSIMEDFDVTLQLLSKGYPNYVSLHYAQDQYKTQIPGGCSDYRDHELHAANVRKMAKLYPKWIKLVEKNNSTGGAFGKRLEANIKWQAALEHGLGHKLPSQITFDIETGKPIDQAKKPVKATVKPKGMLFKGK